jgi:thiamine biosynthesis lipoprotein
VAAEAVGAVAPSLPPDLRKVLRLEFSAMGCQMLVATENESQQAELRLNEVPSWFANWEQIMSRFRPDSELTWLNQQTGSAVHVSPVLWEVMQAAMNAWRDSNGLVSPAILPALEHAGYVKTFRELGDPIPMEEQDRQIREPMADIVLNGNDQAVRLPQGMKLDFGGIAKGWAAHQAMQRMSDLGQVLVDAGGDIAISDSLGDGTPWPIGVNDPFNRGAQIERLYVHQGGVATSGRDHRRWQQGGEWRHHIIDPRTGLPAVTDLLSVTVIAETVMAAETAAKVVLILGSEAGLDWLDQREGMAGLAILENGELLGSNGIEDYMRN